MAARDITLGAEFDGSTLRLVWLADRTVLAYERVAGVSADDLGPLLRRFAKAKPAGRRAMRRGVLSWASPGVSTRRAHAAEGPLRRRVASISEVLDTFIPGGSTLPGAGAVYAGSPSAALPVTVGAISARAAGAVRRALPLDSWRLVASPFTLSFPGVYLSVRESEAELSLVRDGGVIATRQLGCGGLATGLPGGISDTPSGDSAVRRYVAALARELVRTIEYWRREGHTCPTQIWVCGRGATLPHLPSVLSGLGFEASPAPIPDWLDTRAVPEPERLAAYGALSAALLPLDTQPLVELAAITKPRSARASRSAQIIDGPSANFEGIVSGRGDRAYATPESRRGRGLDVPAGIGTLIAGLMLGVVAGVIVWLASTHSLDRSTKRLADAVVARDRANAALEYAGKITLAAQQGRRLATYLPAAWDQPITNLLRAAPSAPPISSLRLALGEYSLVATIVVPNGENVLTDWQAALRTAGDLRSSTPIKNQGVDSIEFVVVLPPPSASVKP